MGIDMKTIWTVGYKNALTELERGRLIKVTLTDVCFVRTATESFCSLKNCICFYQNCVMVIRFHGNINRMTKYVVGQGLSLSREKHKHLMRAANA
jgi:hypothetical protein